MEPQLPENNLVTHDERMKKEITAVIVDDEFSGRATIRNLLENHCPEVRVLGEADSLESGVAAIRQHGPDVVFLDVQLRPGTGFDLLAHFETPAFETIFCTAFDEFAMQAFEFAALHYLKKPIRLGQLQEAVKRFQERSREGRAGRLDVLRENMQAQEIRKIAIPSGTGFAMVWIDEICRCEADGSYTYIHLDSGRKVTASKRLGHFENLLYGSGFHRVHHSHLVNLKKIKSYVKGRGGILRMEDGSEIPVSERMKKGVLERIRNGI